MAEPRPAPLRHRSCLRGRGSRFACGRIADATLGRRRGPRAAAVMAGSSILVVMNSVRLERLPDPVPSLILEQRSGAEAESALHGVGVSMLVGPEIERS